MIFSDFGGNWSWNWYIKLISDDRLNGLVWWLMFLMEVSIETGKVWVNLLLGMFGDFCGAFMAFFHSQYGRLFLKTLKLQFIRFTIIFLREISKILTISCFWCVLYDSNCGLIYVARWYSILSSVTLTKFVLPDLLTVSLTCRTICFTNF